MQIKAVKFRKDGFYSQPFAFGGEEGKDQFDLNIRYRGSLQNYLIDTGKDVILVDTGIPAGTPEEVPNEQSLIYTGKDICSYMDALKALGYQPKQVTKILLTHRHADHSGELRSFPNAQIFVNADELSAAELQGLTNLVPVRFTDGAYYNFPKAKASATASISSKPKVTPTATASSSPRTKGFSICSKATSLTWMKRSMRTNSLLSMTI